jgi:hypothetical protein
MSSVSNYVSSSGYKNIREARQALQNDDKIHRLYVYEDGSSIVPSTLRKATFKPTLNMQVKMDIIGKIFIETAAKFHSTFSRLMLLKSEIATQKTMAAIPVQYLAFAILKGNVTNVPTVDAAELKKLQAEFDTLAPEFQELEEDLNFVVRLIDANKTRFKLEPSAEVQTIYDDYQALRNQFFPKAVETQ